MLKLSMALLVTAGTLVSPTLLARNDGRIGTNPQGDREVVLEWNRLLEGTIPASAGPTLPRYYAMMHIAMFDAVNAIHGGYAPYRAKVLGSRIASADAAAAQAAHDVLVALLPAHTATYDAALNARIAGINPLRATHGSSIGREVARQIVEWRATDGWATPQTFTPPAVPGVWQPTPPAFAPAAFVQAGDAKPFGLPTPYYYLPRRPPELDSQEYADAVNDIKAIGGVNSTVRTAEQTQQARLWASVGYKQLWSATWNNVAETMTRQKDLSLIETARLFALLNASMHDGVQTAQASKFVFQLWRPVTAIQRAGEDMNPATDADPTWMPLLTTPPYPSYAGNMACIGASSARALALYFGTNTLSFDVKWTGLNGNTDVVLPFTSFWQLAEHQAVSREYGGIHYHFDTTASQEVCPKVANYVFGNYMRPRN
jgi:hypothetical protein